MGHFEDKMRWFKGDYANFSFNKCPVYTHDGGSAKFSTNSHKTGNSVWKKFKGGGGWQQKMYEGKVASDLGFLLIQI